MKTLLAGYIWLGALLCASVAGCSRAPDEKDAAQDLPLAAQVQMVRDGLGDEVRLDHTLVRDADLDSLMGLETKLRRVNFSKSEISDAGLARLAEMHELRQLRLSSAKITDDALASLQKLPHLRYLHLLDVPITDAGLVHLHALKGLESLYLDRIKAGDEAIQKLSEALPEVHLHVDGGHPHDHIRQSDHSH